MGLVHITPPDTTCDLTTPNGSQYCENSYTQGDVVILTPVPTGQSVFAGWTFGPCTGSTGPCPVTMSEHQLVTAVFRGPRLLSTMVQSEEGGVGLVHITPPDTTCDLTTPNGSQYCENSYTQGDVVILTPVPTGQSVFAGWTFGPCTGSTGPCRSPCPSISS